MAQKTNPIALRRAAGLRRADGAWAAGWGYTDLALAGLGMDRWSRAWARHLDRAGVRSALVALPRRHQRLDVAAPADRRRGGGRGAPVARPATLLRGAEAAVAGKALHQWGVSLFALSSGGDLAARVSPLAALLSARLAGRASPPRGSPDGGRPLPADARGALLRGWLAGLPGGEAGARGPAARLDGPSGGVAAGHVHATASGHWQSAAYIAGEVARRLSAGAGWSRVTGGFLALCARGRGVAGLRVRCAGRLAGRSRGAARARAINARWGRTALHTLRRPVDYATAVAATGRGAVGVKVWLALHPRS